MALFFALNDQFILSMQVFLHSLIKSNPWFNKDIIILSDGQLSNQNLESLKSIYKNIIKIDAKKNDYKDCLPTTQKWGFNLYYRFDVFDLGYLNYDRIIIFDSDMVVLKDIKDLFTFNYDFGACEKYLGIPEIAPDNPRVRDKKRFNCGLMSISNNLLRPYYKNKLIRCASKKSWSSDQPVFNICFENTVKYLPQKFNIVSSIASEELLKEASIIQYHGFVKPWHSEKPDECFEEFVKEELKINSKGYDKSLIQLKKIFDDYASIFMPRKTGIETSKLEKSIPVSS